MKERIGAAWNHVSKEISPRWYEKENPRIIVAGGVIILLAVSGAIKLGVPLDHLMGGAAFLLSRIANEEAVIRMLEADDRALSAGLNLPVGAYVNNPKAIGTGRIVLDTILSTAVPTASIGLAVAQIFEAMSHRRRERRVNRTIEIVNQDK